jgi:LPXTG-motif cell wall-anchored protein
VIEALLFIVGPSVALLGAGAWALVRRRPSGWKVALVGPLLAGALTWFLYIGLYPHEDPCDANGGRRYSAQVQRMRPCPTFYGNEAPKTDQDSSGGFVLLGGFLGSAFWFGSRRRLPARTIGALTVAVPLLLALSTTPRGDNDGLWMLVFLYLPFVGGLAALAAALGRSVTTKWVQPGLKMSSASNEKA